jgi:hypothetical protein
MTTILIDGFNSPYLLTEGYSSATPPPAPTVVTFPSSYMKRRRPRKPKLPLPRDVLESFKHYLEIKTRVGA